MILSERQGDGYNLPWQPTPFIGREEETVEITRLLTKEPCCRLLTLVGPGGIGKTRLAIHNAAELASKFTHGLYFVPLQALQSADFLVLALSNVLNINLSGQQDPHLQLFNHLRDKELLLILDNFEHLMAGVDLLTELLSVAPAIKFLVTSREALNVPEEWLLPLKGMSYPPAHQTEDLGTYSAISLFVGCARRIRPDFSQANEWEGVIQICQLVEGTPLALELAASWIKIMRSADIATEIRQNLDFLATQWRGIPSRHQSMKAVFNHSWALLSPEEQIVFKQLAVFRKGFRRQAAEQVAGASLATLSALVDKSLLRWEQDGRYQIHELLCQYAMEQLEQAPEAVTRIYDLHSQYYLSFLGERAEDFRGGRQRAALDEIEAELENIRFAWQWAVGQLKVDQLQKSVVPLGNFYDIRGWYLEGVRVFEEASQRLEGQPDARQNMLVQVLLLIPLGGLYIRLGRLEEAEARLGQCQALYHQLDLPPLPGYDSDPVFLLGIIATIRGDYIEAARLGAQVYQASIDYPHLLNRQSACYLLGRAALLQGQYEKAQADIQQAYLLTQETKDRWFMAYCLNELGNVACALGHYEAAREHYTVSYELKKEFNDPEGMAASLNCLGEVAIWQENLAEAQRLYRQSLVISQRINNLGGMVVALNGLGYIALASGDYPTAQQQFQQAFQFAREGQFVSLILTLLAGAGEFLAQTGRTEQGLELLALALHHPGSEPGVKERVRQKLNRYQWQLPSEQFLAASQALTWSDLEAVAARTQAALNPQVEIDKQRYNGGEETKNFPAPPPTPQPALVEPLTEREAEILNLLAKGLSNGEIAGQLILAMGTVKYYTSIIYGKLGVRNRTQAVVRAHELGLLSPQ